MDEKLTKKGWFLSDEGVKTCQEFCGKPNPSCNDIIQAALGCDLRLIARKKLPEEHVQALQGPLVLQVQKIRNVSAPLLNQESQGAPRMLRMHLTDGHTTVMAIEFKSIPALNTRVIPGTKICIKGNVTVLKGILLLEDCNVHNLGGHVEKLKYKWESNQQANNRTNFKTEDGPPPFQDFDATKYKATPVEQKTKDTYDKSNSSLYQNSKKQSDHLDRKYENDRNTVFNSKSDDKQLRQNNTKSQEKYSKGKDHFSDRRDGKHFQSTSNDAQHTKNKGPANNKPKKFEMESQKYNQTSPQSVNVSKKANTGLDDLSHKKTVSKSGLAENSKSNKSDATTTQQHKHKENRTTDKGRHEVNQKEKGAMSSKYSRDVKKSDVSTDSRGSSGRHNSRNDDIAWKEKKDIPDKRTTGTFQKNDAKKRPEQNKDYKQHGRDGKQQHNQQKQRPQSKYDNREVQKSYKEDSVRYSGDKRNNDRANRFADDYHKESNIGRDSKSSYKKEDKHGYHHRPRQQSSENYRHSSKQPSSITKHSDNHEKEEYPIHEILSEKLRISSGYPAVSENVTSSQERKEMEKHQPVQDIPLHPYPAQLPRQNVQYVQWPVAQQAYYPSLQYPGALQHTQNVGITAGSFPPYETPQVYYKGTDFMNNPGHFSSQQPLPTNVNYISQMPLNQMSGEAQWSKWSR